MTEYKLLTRRTFGKESTFLEEINLEAKNRWQVINVCYSMEGSLLKVMLERSKGNL